MEALPEDLRTAIVLREIDGLSYEEIAQVEDCPIGTVKVANFPRTRRDFLVGQAVDLAQHDRGARSSGGAIAELQPFRRIGIVATLRLPHITSVVVRLDDKQLTPQYNRV